MGATIHLHVHVSSLEKSREFYRMLFGLRDMTAQQLEKEGTALLDKLRGEYIKLDAALRQKVQEARRG